MTTTSLGGPGPSGGGRIAAANAAGLASALLFGASIVATRVVVQEVPPLTLAVLRFGQGGLLLALCLLVAAPGRLRVRPGDLPRLALLGAILFAAFPAAFNTGLRLTEASQGALMLATMPLWSAVLGRAAAGERLLPRQILGLLLSLLGVGAVLAERGLAWQADPRALLGNGLVLLAASLGGAYSVLAKPALARHGAPSVTAYAMLFGVFALLPVAWAEASPEAITRVGAGTAALIVFLGVFGGALGYALITFAMGRLTPSQATAYINLNPIAATALGVAVLGETPTVAFAVGFLTVVGGVLLVNWPRGATAQVGRLLASISSNRRGWRAMRAGRPRLAPGG